MRWLFKIACSAQNLSYLLINWPFNVAMAGTILWCYGFWENLIFPAVRWILLVEDFNFAYKVVICLRKYSIEISNAIIIIIFIYLTSKIYNSVVNKKVLMKSDEKYTALNYYICFSIWVFFHNNSQIKGLQGKGEAICLTPHYHLHPLHRHLEISRAITANSSPLHIGSSRTRTGNLCFPRSAINLEQIGHGNLVQHQFFNPFFNNSNEHDFFKSKGKVSYNWLGLLMTELSMQLFLGTSVAKAWTFQRL